MPSHLQSLAELQFEGDGSHGESMRWLVTCARIVGEVTGDEQCLGIAEGLSQMDGARKGGNAAAALVGGSRTGAPLTGPQRQPASPQRGLVGG